MSALNHQLNQTMIDADGRYLSNEELRPLETYLDSYQKRLEAYQTLGQHSDELVLEALKKFARVHPEIIKNSGKRCQYDMLQVLRYMALCILLDDEFMFREKMVFWLDTMLRAHHKQEACCKAYQHLKEVLHESLPGKISAQVDPYINIIFESMQPYT
jgi:hypothetical protein